MFNLFIESLICLQEKKEEMKIKSIKHLPCPTTKSRTIPIYSEYNFVALAFLTINFLIGLHLRYSRASVRAGRTHVQKFHKTLHIYHRYGHDHPVCIATHTAMLHTFDIGLHIARFTRVYIRYTYTHARAGAHTHTLYTLHVFYYIYIHK